MPTKRVEDLVSKIVASSVSREKAERIVSRLNKNGDCDCFEKC